MNIGYVEGNGTTTESHSYSFDDEAVQPGRYLYRLKQMDFDGSFEYSNIAEAEIITPIKFVLEQNYPNPFNPSTLIKFALPVKTEVTLEVYNSIGQKIRTLVQREMESGYHQVHFDADNLPSGVYFCRLNAGRNVKTIKMILIR